MFVVVFTFVDRNSSKHSTFALSGTLRGAKKILRERIAGSTATFVRELPDPTVPEREDAPLEMWATPDETCRVAIHEVEEGRALDPLAMNGHC